MFKSVCVVTEGYPYQNDPQFSFVGELCAALSRKGIRVYVVSPQSIIHIILRRKIKHPLERTIIENGAEPITVYRPMFFQLPYRFRTYNEKAYKRIVERTFYKKGLTPDVCYGHFWNNAYYISEVSKKKRLPLFVASGEGNFDELEGLYKSAEYRAFTNNVVGVICVSSSCRDCSVSLGMTTKDKCVVIPNAIDHSKFYVKDKCSLRKQYGIPNDLFIIAFAGSLIHRKGPDRLSSAIERLHNPNIASFFIGGGQGSEKLIPKCDGVLFCGQLPHDKVSDYFNMADIFVLPTLNEGCCNAIIEAMACGLPIVSSDRPFNYDLLTPNNSILVDPTDIDSIANAIKQLYDNPMLRDTLRKGAIETAKSQRIDIRAERIIDFINKQM